MMTVARIAALVLATVTLAGCLGSGGPEPTLSTPRANSGATRADLAAAHAALTNGSRIYAPFRPARVVGWRSCAIPEGGPPGLKEKAVPGRCETRVVRRAGFRLVIFSESWRARDFRGSGGSRFRKPGSRHRLTTSWLVAVAPSGEVRHVRVRGDFPPQLVM
jgi:hypothetical protein